jgi:hypothetical protein
VDVVAAADLDRGGGDTAADVEHPVAIADLGTLEQTLGRLASAGMDHTLAEHGHELVRVEPRDLGCGQRLHGGDTTT